MAPICGRFTKSVNSSNCLRVYSAAFSALIPITNSALSNTPKPFPFTNSFISTNCIPKRKSGLSLPYNFIASSYCIRGKSANSIPFTVLKTCLIKPSNMFKISSCSTKAISQSICVNSGCLSARKSSSLKHLVI